MTAPKVFIDIGGHNGGSVAAVFDGGYAFDRAVSVEPDPQMVAILESRFAAEIAAGKYQVAPVGLSDKNGTAQLFGDNTHGSASMIEQKFGDENKGAAREITLIDWPTFVERYQLHGARLWIKVNAEGAEIAIIESILAGGGNPGIESMVIYFDIVKSPFGSWKKWRAMKALRAAGIPFLLAEEVLNKTGPRPRLHNWLSAFPDLKNPPIPADPAPLSKLIRMHYLDWCSAIGIRLDMFKRRAG